MKAKLLLIFIIFLAAFMRFYNLQGLFHFSMDEEYWSYIPLNIASGYHLPLIGGSIADTGLYTTPWFVYLMSMVSFIGKGNPLVFGVFVSALGVLTTFLVFYLGKKMFDQKTAFLASFLFAGSALISLWDRHYWNASLTPILSLLVLYLVFKRKFILLGLVISLAVSAHGTGVTFIIFTIFSTILLVPKNEWKKSLVVVLILTFSFVPLFFFEARHNFQNSKAFINYFSQKKNVRENIIDRTKNVLGNFIYTSGKIITYTDNNDVSSQLTLGDTSLDRGMPTILSWIVLILLVVSLLKGKFSIGEKLSIVMIVSNIVGLIIFKSPISSYYYTPMAISLLYLISSRIFFNKAVYVLLFLILIFNINKIITYRHSGIYQSKLNTVDWIIKDANGQPFEVNVVCVGHCVPYGFRYLFSYRKVEPVASYMDSYFSWFYADKIGFFKPRFRYTLLVSDFKIDVEKSNAQ